MRFRLDHPTRPGVVIYYGVDHALPGGFWAESHESDVLINFDGLTPSSKFDPNGRTLEQILHFISDQGVYTRDDLHEVLLIHERGGKVPKRLRLVSEVVENLKRAADGG